jgi:hypothetical protein
MSVWDELSITSSILAFNHSASLLSNTDPAVTVVSCTNIYGNENGDWMGDLAPFASDPTNFSQNPIFCDLAGGNFELDPASPCLPGQHPNAESCDTVGAKGVGTCSATPEPVASLVLSSPDLTTIHPGETIALDLELVDASLFRTRDIGIPPFITEATGLGALDPLLLDGLGLWNSSFTAGSVVGAAAVTAHDPESPVPDSDPLVIRVTEASIIRSVGDIPDDQGWQVRVRWRADMRDTLGHADPVTHYVVWRRVDDDAAIAGRTVLPWDRWRTSEKAAPALLAANGEVWEPVGPQVPAMMWQEYASVVPTIIDGTAAGFSVFFVSSHTASPQDFRSSYPDSGYSEDNLAPLPPVGVAKMDVGEGVEVDWQPNEEEDLHSYRIYRSTVRDFAPRLDLLVGETGGPSWSSTEGAGQFYRVTAVDFTGNESEAVLAGGISPAGQVPARGVTLHQNVPNPFNPSTKLAFEMGRPGSARLAIYDVSGRLVRTLVDRHLGEGRHEFRWDGRDGQGRGTSAGVYLYRLTTPDGDLTRRMVLVE